MSSESSKMTIYDNIVMQLDTNTATIGVPLKSQRTDTAHDQIMTLSSGLSRRPLRRLGTAKGGRTHSDDQISIQGLL